MSFINTDSGVCLGAIGRGRSSSFRLNGKLREINGWTTLCKKYINNVHIRSKFNPGDPPSRFMKILIQEAPIGLKQYLMHEFVPMNIHRAPQNGSRLSREIFAGSAMLSRSLHHYGIPTGSPMDCFREGKYIPEQDLERPEVFESLLRDICSGLIIYLHFGIVCSTWGPASRFQPIKSRSTRSRTCILGDGSKPKEVQGNIQAHHVGLLCSALIQHHGYFSIENPAGSYVFMHPNIQCLSNHIGVYMFNLDQCSFGLQLPGSAPHHFVRKRTSILSNMPELFQLSRKCPGISNMHQHERCWGSRSREGQQKSISLTSASARYTSSMCNLWAQCCKECFSK